MTSNAPDLFAAEYQRRLRVVLGNRARVIIPDDARVSVHIEGQVDGYESSGFYGVVEVSLSAECQGGATRFVTNTDDEFGAGDRLLADLLAVPDTKPLDPPY